MGYLRLRLRYQLVDKATYLRLRLRLKHEAVCPPEGSVAVEVARGESLQ